MTTSNNNSISSNSSSSNSSNGNSKDISTEIQLERSFLKVPVECLNKTFRGSQKNLEKEMNNVLSQITELNKKKESIGCNDAMKTIDKLLVRVQKLKRSMEDAKSEEELQIKKLKSRINHLSQATTNQHFKSFREKFNDDRVNRIIIDYLLRQGYYDTAIELTNQLNLKELIDIEIFLSSKRVVEGLNKFDCTEALNWCNENKSKLKKIDSMFEFNIRIQEFIELVRKNKTIEAINYAKTHLSAHSTTNMKEIQQAMATLIFGKDSKCERYNRMFDSQRWLDLITQFKNENFQLHCLSTRSLLDISLQSGLSVLKTSLCGDHNSFNVQCPLCDEAWRKLAISLPVSLQSHSSLVCRISGEIMNDENYPCVLPNGNVYSKHSLVDMNEKQGKIIDPRTGDEFKFDELKRAFIS